MASGTRRSSTPAMSTIRYLVTIKMTGDESRLLMIYEYAMGESPSDIAHKYGVSKNVVRGMIMRVQEKFGRMTPVVVKFLREVIPIIINNVPSIFDCSSGSVCKCKICGMEVINEYDVKRYHVSGNHHSVVEYYAVEVASRYLEKIRIAKNMRL